MVAARPAPSTRTVIAILVAAMVLFAQWVGLNHKISHATLPQITHAAAVAAEDADVGGIHGDIDADHSCTAFDAATIGDSIHITPFVTPLVTSAQVLALWAAFISWDAPVTAYFSSRAPPGAC